MPLHDHFKSPLQESRPWEGFHSAWAAMIADQLNASVLPKDYVAMPHVHRGTAVEIDVATLQERSPTTTAITGWSATQPTWTVPIEWNLRDLFEVRILQVEGPLRLVAAIELVSPANKDRPAHRQAFAGKCAGYLRQGIALIVVDVVTERTESVHCELLELLELNGTAAFEAKLYAIAYRTVEAGAKNRLEIWANALKIGGSLPTLPLWLTPECAIPVDLDAAYERTCQSLRIG
jgi:hypothetical protein